MHIHGLPTSEMWLIALRLSSTASRSFLHLTRTACYRSSGGMMCSQIGCDKAILCCITFAASKR